jgi:hypothetical protein
MKRKYLIFTAFLFIFTALVASFFTPPLTAQQVHIEQIRQFDVFAVVNKDGTVYFTEYITYDFPQQRHGIIREIPYVIVNEDGDRYRMSFSDISVRDDNGNPYKIEKSSSQGNVVLKIGDPGKTISGRHTYVVRYTVSGALAYFAEHDELYWNVTGNDWDVRIIESNFEVSLPAQVPAGDINTVCYTGVFGEQKGNCNIRFIHERGITVVNTTQPLNPRNGLTVAVKFPKGVVDVLEPQRDHTSILTYILMGIFGILGLIWYVIFPFKIFGKWRRDHINSKSARIVAAWFDPPKGPDGNFLNPAETSALVDKNIDHKDVSATLIHLAQRGYFKIKENDKGEFSIILTGKEDGLSEPEKLLFDKIKSSAKDNELTLKGLSENRSLGGVVEKFKTETSKGLVGKGLFEHDPRKTDQLYTFFGVAGVFTLNLLLAVSSFFFGTRSAARTALGIEKYGESRSLKNFLSSQDAQLEFQAKNQMFFEKLLPYATAFGVENVWAKRFSDIQMIAPDWYEGQRFNQGFYTSFAGSARNSIRLSYNTHNRASSTRSSTGFSSGFSGGSSGGGRGGGGGRSW